MKLKVGIIGLGVGEAHLEAYQLHPHCEVASLCDFSEDKLSQIRKKHPHYTYTLNAMDILDDPAINVVSIASYDNFHFEQIERALDHNKHVFVEKPLCLYREQAVKIYAALKKKPHLKISSNLILRKCPRFQKLRQMIQDGEMGNIYYMEGDYLYGRIHKITEGWRGKLDYYSIVYGGAVHIVDLFHWMTGKKVVEVMAYGNQIASEGSQFKYHDFAACLLKFADGTIGKITANFGCVHPHFHGITIYGTKGTFTNGLEYGNLFTARDAGIPPQKMTDDYPGVHKGDLIHNFIDSILNDTSPTVSTEDIFNTMSVCFAIEESSLKSKAVSVSSIL